MVDRASSVILRMKQMSSSETQSMRAEEWSLGCQDQGLWSHLAGRQNGDQGPVVCKTEAGPARVLMSMVCIGSCLADWASSIILHSEQLSRPAKWSVLAEGSSLSPKAEAGAAGILPSFACIGSSMSD